MKRRDFVKLSGCFVATASLAGVACSDDDGTAGADASNTNTYSFPEGVASGDPHADSVVLWTRAVAATAEASTSVTVELATSEAFTEILVSEEVAITDASDWTLRMLVDGLQPATWYWYRFRAGSDESEVGRTRTAPAATADVNVNLAWVSCQDYVAGLYDAYRIMIDDDIAAAEADQIHFVMHVGDFIYETVNDGFQDAVNEEFESITFNDRQGRPRQVDAFPSGGAVVTGHTFADTLDDYRHLYKQFLRDPELRAARARWPFVQTWDDHEFVNDCWQSQGNFDESATLGEPRQNGRMSASQAWFEYIPTNLTGAGSVSGVTSQAKDFAAATVTDAAFTDFDANGFATNADNVAAVGAITIYRSLRFGANCEIIMTDLRSYRSDHAVPEDSTKGSAAYFDPRNALPLELVNTMDGGAMYNGGNPPPTVLGIDNARMSSPPGTCMGATQKQWFKDSLMGSDATWKIWGNEFPLFRLLIEQGPIGALLADRILNADAWDGYNFERKELMKFISDNQIPNVVSLSGDVHAHYAGYVNDDFDIAAGSQVPVMVELTTAGITSNSKFMFLEGPTRSGAVVAIRPGVTYHATDNPGGEERFIENLNLTLLYGTQTAVDVANTLRSDSVAKAALDAGRLANPDANPHMTYIDTNAQGFGRATITATEIQAELVTVNRPIDPTRAPSVKRTASFTIPKVNAGQVPTLTGPAFTGTKPWPTNLE